MGYILSNRSKTRLEGVHPFLIDVVTKGIINSPFDFGIPPYGGLRTTADLQKLYAKGRTEESIEKGQKPVTYTDGVRKKSRHQIKTSGYGEAFDIYIFDHGTQRASWNAEKLEAVAIHLLKVAEQIKEENEDYKDLILIWGGSWTRFKDRPHFEIKRA